MTTNFHLCGILSIIQKIVLFKLDFTADICKPDQLYLSYSHFKYVTQWSLFIWSIFIRNKIYTVTTFIRSFIYMVTFPTVTIFIRVTFYTVDFYIQPFQTVYCIYGISLQCYYLLLLCLHFINKLLVIAMQMLGSYTEAKKVTKLCPGQFWAIAYLHC